jgi:hypothetical protein
VTGHRCTPECVEIMRLRRENQSIDAVAAALGISRGSVTYVMRVHGLPRLPPKPGPGRPKGRREVPWAQDAILLHKQGLVLNEIGMQIGVTRERVRQVLKEHGLFSTGRGHFCNEVCRALLAEVKSGGAIHFMGFAQRTGLSLTRVTWAANHHHISGAGRGHVCTDRCEKMREGLAAGLNVRQAGIAAGWPKNSPYLYTHLKVRHPDWAWPTLPWWKRKRLEGTP